MNFLLDTDICANHLKCPSGLTHRFIQYPGRLFIPTIVLAELHAWAHQRDDPDPLLRSIDDLLQDVTVLEFDRRCAEQFGRLSAVQLWLGIPVSRRNLMIAAVALVHNLILVTHNTSDYIRILGLALDDWLTP